MKGLWVVNDEIYDFKKNQLNLFSPDSKVDTDLFICLAMPQSLSFCIHVRFNVGLTFPRKPGLYYF